MKILLDITWRQNISHIWLKTSVTFLLDGQMELKQSYFICYLHFE